MTDALALGEKLLTLLDTSARTSTYKSALLLAIVDRAQEHLEDDVVSVRALAERVIELYWPQTLPYATTGSVLVQTQGGAQATIVRDVAAFRASVGAPGRALPQGVRGGTTWDDLVERVELVLAEWPIPRLQVPYTPFLYDFDWTWQEQGRWSVRAYRTGSRSLRLKPEVASSLVALGPLLRPFITRWWTDKAAQLNPDVEAARSVVEFEDFLFGRDRVALARIAEGLLDLQVGRCFYCAGPVSRQREVDHFIPWTLCGDDGLDNLVVACRRCNSTKRATLAGPGHLEHLVARNRRWNADLGALATERRWPRDTPRSWAIAKSAYLRAPDERPLWSWASDGATLTPVADLRGRLREILEPR
jgi:hypothetical protein